MPLYSDLNSYTPTDKALLTDVEAVYQSIDNIINALLYERLFRPDFPGETLEDVLFEFIDDITSVSVFRIVVNMIEKWEPRVTVDTSQTQVFPDPDNNRYELFLAFNILGFGSQRFELRGSLKKP